MSEWPVCEAFNCENEAECDVVMDGESGCFIGKLCSGHERAIRDIIRPAYYSSSLLRILTFEALNTALSDNLKEDGA